MGSEVDEHVHHHHMKHGGCEDVKRVREALFGNGHPEASVLVRLKSVEKKLSHIYVISWAIASSVGVIATQIIRGWIEAAVG